MNSSEKHTVRLPSIILSVVRYDVRNYVKCILSPKLYLMLLMKLVFTIHGCFRSRLIDHYQYKDTFNKTATNFYKCVLKNVTIKQPCKLIED